MEGKTLLGVVGDDTLTKFPIRRLDLEIGVAYEEDINRVREILLGVNARLEWKLSGT